MRTIEFLKKIKILRVDWLSCKDFKHLQYQVMRLKFRNG